MERPFLQGIVKQNHKTGYFELTDFEKEINRIRYTKGLQPKKLHFYFETASSKEFLASLSIEEDIPENELRITKKGRNGGTWVHPLVFLDIALWADSELKVKVYKWIYDNLLLFRENSGESFKNYNKVLSNTYPYAFKDSSMYARVATKIRCLCGLQPHQDWNTATESQLRLRDDIHTNIINICELAEPTDVLTTLNKAMERALDL
jgi:hypothetical protein